MNKTSMTAKCYKMQCELYEKWLEKNKGPGIVLIDPKSDPIAGLKFFQRSVKGEEGRDK